MNVIDLTHTIKEDMPVFPGSESPILEITSVVERDGFAERKITLYSHTGTHMDAPMHMIPGGLGLDEFSGDKFFGPGVVVDAKNEIKIGLEILYKYVDEIEKSDFILINTGWDRYWGEDRYYRGFPCLTEEAAKWLAQKDIKGVGIDAISVDPMDSEEFYIHKIFLEKDIVIVENLKLLETLLGKEFHLSCMPLKLERSDGSPIRAVAVLGF